MLRHGFAAAFGGSFAHGSAMMANSDSNMANSDSKAWNN